MSIISIAVYLSKLRPMRILIKLLAVMIGITLLTFAPVNSSPGGTYINLSACCGGFISSFSVDITTATSPPSFVSCSGQPNCYGNSNAAYWMGVYVGSQLLQMGYFACNPSCGQQSYPSSPYFANPCQFVPDSQYQFFITDVLGSGGNQQIVNCPINLTISPNSVHTYALNLVMGTTWNYVVDGHIIQTTTLPLASSAPNAAVLALEIGSPSALQDTSAAPAKYSNANIVFMDGSSKQFLSFPSDWFQQSVSSPDPNGVSVDCVSNSITMGSGLLNPLPNLNNNPCYNIRPPFNIWLLLAIAFGAALAMSTIARGRHSRHF